MKNVGQIYDLKKKLKLEKEMYDLLEKEEARKCTVSDIFSNIKKHFVDEKLIEVCRFAEFDSSLKWKF